MQIWVGAMVEENVGSETHDADLLVISVCIISFFYLSFSLGR